MNTYKNAPVCPTCQMIMRYLYTHVASDRSVWKCDNCNKKVVTQGFPEEDEEPHKRNTLEVNYGFRRIGEDYGWLQNNKVKMSWV